MRAIFYLLTLPFIYIPISGHAAEHVALHMVGDSTMSDKPEINYPERGWGQMLPGFMTSELTVKNHAVNGRSTRQFVNEGRWAAVLSVLNKGDYVLIQFGHNDQKKDDPARYTSAQKAYPDYLRKFIDDVRSRNATPLLASSVCRRHFDSQGVLQRTLADYASAARQVAMEKHVAFFDLNKHTCSLLTELGDDQSKQYYTRVPPGLYARYPDGKTDNTHLNLLGAAKVAQLFVEDLRQQKHPLAAYIHSEFL